MRALCTAVDAVTDLGARLAALLLALIVVFFWTEVVARYFFNAPLNFTASLSPHMTMVAVMTMLPWLSREGYHVAMSFVYEKAPERFARPIGIAIVLVSAAVCALSAWMSGAEAWRQYANNVVAMEQIIFPLWWVTIFMAYGFACAAFHFLRQAATGRIVQRSEV
ncbi:MAG: TRAP transporter small permease [Beijerinckiaceae bacterium]